ncbi:MAG: SprB repeat-containing protein [Saprospiraceae bacterium]
MASTSTLSSLNPGQYCVTVTDNNGCEFTGCYNVNAVKTLAINEVITNLDCNGDNSGEILVTGTTSGAPADLPYTFAWSASASAPINTNTTSQLLGLAAGTYTVTMTDASTAGCEVIETYTVTEPAILVVNALSFNNETCIVGNDGSITLGVTGGTAPYAYTWMHDVTLTDSIATNLSAGDYTVDVTDANGCMASFMQSISAPTPPSVIMLADDSVTCFDDIDGVLQVTAAPAPGTTITSYAWSNGQNGNTITGLSYGQYIVTITADNACITVDTAFI